jgi:hypothetical protein
MAQARPARHAAGGLDEDIAQAPRAILEGAQIAPAVTLAP